MFQAYNISSQNKTEQDLKKSEEKYSCSSNNSIENKKIIFLPHSDNSSFSLHSTEELIPQEVRSTVTFKGGGGGGAGTRHGPQQPSLPQKPTDAGVLSNNNLVQLVKAEN